MFGQIKLKYRILLGSCVPLLLSVAVLAGVYINIKRLEERKALVDAAYEIANISRDMAFSIVKAQRSVRGYLLAKNEASLKSFEAGGKAYRDQAQVLQKMVKDSAQQEGLRKILETADQLDGINRAFLSLVNEGKQAKAIEDFKSGVTLDLGRRLEEMVEAFAKKESELLRERQAGEEEAIHAVLRITLLGTLVSIVLSLGISLLLSSRIGRTIGETTNALSATSTEIASTVVEHERTASQQAAMVTQTTSTVEELGASSRQSAEQAASAADVAQKASMMTENGKEAVRRVIDGMRLLKDKVGTVADHILRLGEQTSQIGNIANLVKDLAGETNMLALNAAVEAARAGEHGKGFAVVASEVRKLADQSKKSAEQANVLIADIQKATNSTIMMTEEGTKTVNEVTDLALALGELFGDLANAAGMVYENAQQVLLNARQQSSALGQVVEAVNSINQSARETAAGISQTKVGIENLTKAAENLQSLV